MSPAESSDDRARVLALLKRHGWHVTSFQVLEPQFRYRIAGEGCVAFAQTRTAWVAAGAPIADRAEIPERMREFTAAAASEGKRARFFAIERAFVPEGFRAVAIGARPVWDPANWEQVLRSHRSLREQVRRARAKQVIVRRASADELADGKPLRSRVDALIARWLRSKPMPAMGFLVDVHPFAFGEERRYFVAEQGEQVVGFLAAVPVYARNGWLLEDLLRDPSAPNGVTELLVDAAMRTFAAEGSRFATLGQVPLAGIERGWLKAIRDRSRWLYDFEGLRAFKAKLRPDTWEELCLAFPEGDNEARAVFDTLAAFAHGSFLRFGVNTVLHAAPLTARALAIALVPWTALLAIAPAEVWFPSAAVKWGWVGFDVFMAAALLWLSVRWRTALATLLASLATLDGALTVIQAITFNIPGAHRPLSWLAIAAGVAAPIVASAFLWRARRHGSELLRGQVSSGRS